MTDPIADMLSRIKNALHIRAETVDVPHSKIKERLAAILAAEGYIYKAETLKRMSRQYLRLGLKYTSAKKPAITGLKRISTPGRRVYVEARRVPRVQSGYGMAVLSTSLGVLTDGQARDKKVGGEVICYVF